MLDFITNFFNPNKAEPIYDADLLERIRDVKADLNLCRKNLEYTCDSTLTDMYIHAIIANEMKYKYLLGIAKKQYDEKCG